MAKGRGRKRVLFIGATFYNFKAPEKVLHLKEKFEGLFKELDVFVLARGRPFHKKIWGCGFWLYPCRFLFLVDALGAGFLMCLFKKIDVLVAQSPLTEGFYAALLKKFLRHTSRNQYQHPLHSAQ